MGYELRTSLRSGPRVRPGEPESGSRTARTPIHTSQSMRLDRRFSIRSLFATYLAAPAAVLALVSLASSAQAQGYVSQSAATITTAQFGSLRWLNGDWRGRMPDGKAFHERYRFANDSTIIVTSFGDDSTFKRATQTDTIALRSGVVRQGAATLTRVSEQGLSFANLSNTASNYDFARLPGGSWTATIYGAKDGKPTKVVYHMQRVR